MVDAESREDMDNVRRVRCGQETCVASQAVAPMRLPKSSTTGRAFTTGHAAGSDVSFSQSVRVGAFGFGVAHF